MQNMIIFKCQRRKEITTIVGAPGSNRHVPIISCKIL